MQSSTISSPAQAAQYDSAPTAALVCLHYAICTAKQWGKVCAACARHATIVLSILPLAPNLSLPRQSPKYTTSDTLELYHPPDTGTRESVSQM